MSAEERELMERALKRALRESMEEVS